VTAPVGGPNRFSVRKLMKITQSRSVRTELVNLPASGLFNNLYFYI
jgi:hypothetical protein